MTDQTPPPPPSQSPPPPPQGPQPPKKKGLSPLAWVAIGCGGLLVLGMIALVAGGVWVFGKGRDMARDLQEDPAMATAETMIKLNPELELVESDRDTDTLTIRNKRTGEEMTVDLADVQEGKIGFTSEEGETRFEVGGEGEGVMSVTKDGEETLRLGGGAATDLPGWLPVYPGTEPASLYSSREGGTASGAFTVATQDPAVELLDWYQEALEEAGLEVRRTDVSGTAAGEGLAGTLEATAADGRTAGVMAMRTGEETRATVNYESPE